MISIQRLGRMLAAAAVSATLAACAAKAPPVVIAPPPPPIVIPARPLPPLGAVATMTIPALDPLGVRRTVNSSLTPAQTIWNLRSALNVAALNCLDPKYEPILEGYKALLKNHARGLREANRTLDSEFRQKYGATFSEVRDSYMTQVYNYFALPPALPDFCEAALGVANDSLLVAPADLNAFAATALPRLEQVFENFFRAYEQYRLAAAGWDAQYGAQYGASAPGYSNPLAPGWRDPALGPPLSGPVPGGALTTPAPAPAPLTSTAPTLVVPSPSPPAASAPGTPGAPSPRDPAAASTSGSGGGR